MVPTLTPSHPTETAPSTISSWPFAANECHDSNANQKKSKSNIWNLNPDLFLEWQSIWTMRSNMESIMTHDNQVRGKQKNQIINQHPQKQKQENIPHSPSKKLTLQIRMGGGNGLGSLPHNEATASPTTGYHENHLSWVQKVMQLPMSYDCLTRMLTHPLRHYILGLRAGLFWHGLTRSLRRHICYINICPHRKCLREPFFHVRETIHVQVEHLNCVFVLITSSFVVCFCQPFANCILAFAGIGVIHPFRELSRRIFWNKCACPLLTSIGQFWHQGLSGWHCGLGLRGPYAHLTRPLRGFHLHWLEISSWNLDPINRSFLILPLSDLTRETLRDILSNKKLTRPYAELNFPYAGRPYDKAPT